MDEEAEAQRWTFPSLKWWFWDLNPGGGSQSTPFDHNVTLLLRYDMVKSDREGLLIGTGGMLMIGGSQVLGVPLKKYKITNTKCLLRLST